MAALAGDFRSNLGLANAEAAKLAKVVVNEFGAVTRADFDSMCTADQVEAIRGANLKKISIEKLKSVTCDVDNICCCTHTIVAKCLFPSM